MKEIDQCEDLKFNLYDGKFLVRSAGILVSNDSVLLHRKECDDFWALIGGKVREYESSMDAVKREYHEELNIEDRVERLLWMIENFYTLNSIQYHELQFVYLLTSENIPMNNDEITETSEG